MRKTQVGVAGVSGGPPTAAPGWIQVPGPAWPHRTLLLLILFPLPPPAAAAASAAVGDEPTLRGADAAGAPAMALLPRTWIIQPSAETTIVSSSEH